MATDKDTEKKEKKETEGARKETGTQCCYYVVDTCGCYVDPCGCYVDPCCC